MKKLTLILTFSIALISNGLFACSCIGERTVKEEIKHSDAVITGEIISKSLITLIDSTSIKMFGNDSIELKGFPYETIVAKYELVITSIYKGEFKSETIEVYTGLGNGDCGLRFQIGQEYIIYGMKETYFGQINNDWPFPKGKNIIWTDICSRTTKTNKEEISEIKKYKKRK